jgi:anti-anti-sigma regulatory factor
MSVSLDLGEAQCLMRLEGKIDINSAAELKKLLLLALQSGKEVRLDLGQATDLDVTAMQLLWAANREARKLGSTFAVAGHLPESICTVVSEAGFEGFPVPVDQKIVDDQAFETVRAL